MSRLDKDLISRRQANVSTLKAAFSRFLRLVKSGGEVTVLDRDRPVAKIVPYAPGATLQIHKSERSPAGLKKLFDMAPPGKRTDSLRVLLEDREKR